MSQTDYKLETTNLRTASSPAGNSTYKKLAVQWLNEAFCFVSSFEVADNFVLLNPPERKSRNRWASY
jgi:hypothetical protein